MNQASQHSIPYDQFLNLSGNLLAKAFFDASRTQAKQRYQTLVKGEAIPLSRVMMDDQSSLDVSLTANCEEYCGKISFSDFRAQLRLLLQRFIQAVEQDEKIEVLMDESGGSSVFKLPIIHAPSDQQVNALALAFSSLGTGHMQLCLMYLDPEQFRIDAADQA